MKTLTFYDLKFKEKFDSSKYKKVPRSSNGRKRYFAIATAPSGIESWRIISKADFDGN